MSNNSSNGYIYVIITREFIALQESVVKAGYTKDIVHRFYHYPKNSKLLFCQYVEDAYETEKRVLQELRQQYVQRKDIGKEYFEGQIWNIVATVKSVLADSTVNVFISSKTRENQNTEEENENVKDEDVKVEARITDPDRIIQEFFEQNKGFLNNQILKSSDVYDKYTTWAYENKHSIARHISQKRLTTGLKAMFGVKNYVHRFEDGVSQAICFAEVADSDDEETRSKNKYLSEYIEYHHGSLLSLKQIRDHLATTTLYNHIYNIKFKEYIKQYFGVECKAKKIKGVCVHNCFLNIRFKQESLAM